MRVKRVRNKNIMIIFGLGLADEWFFCAIFKSIKSQSYLPLKMFNIFWLNFSGSTSTLDNTGALVTNFWQY